MKKGRKPTGGKYKKSRKKKFYERAGIAIAPKIGENKTKTKRKQGGSKKTIILTTNLANITDGKKTKKAKITNRPSQEGHVQAVLIKE